MRLTVLDICSGAGGEGLGLEQAGFEVVGAVDINSTACETMRRNRPAWNVIHADICDLDGRQFRGVDLLAAGVPCPPFSIAGKQLGSDDERDLFPEAVRLVEEVKPGAVLFENVRGFASDRFDDYRRELFSKLQRLGYEADQRVLSAADFGVPQLRPRFVLVAMRAKHFRAFLWPAVTVPPPTVGEAIGDLMASRGWPGATAWIANARGIAPTLVGGSTKHGGPDLGPTRARREWARLGVDGLGVADEPPGPEFPVNARPKLTVRMAARIQGIPDEWHIVGRKTAAYRQVGNAFPPPVARSLGLSISSALSGAAGAWRGAPGQVRLFEKRPTAYRGRASG